MNDSPTLLSLKGEFNNLALLVPINVSGGFASAQIHLVSHLSAELQSGRWTSVSGPFTSCQHHTNSNNNDDVHGEPHPALTLLPWLEYFFTESARPWTKRRSRFSYSAVGEERKYDGHASKEAVVCTQLRKVLLIEFSLTICKKEPYRRSSLPAAIRLCNRTQ